MFQFRLTGIALALFLLPQAALADASRCEGAPPVADAGISELVDGAVESALGWVGINNLPQRAGALAVRARAQVISIGSGVQIDRTAFARHYVYETCRILTAKQQTLETVTAVIAALETSLGVKL